MFTPLFNEAQAVQLAVALGNLALMRPVTRRVVRSGNLRLGSKAAQLQAIEDAGSLIFGDVSHREVLESLSGKQWIEWAKTSRLWLLLALRQKSGIGAGNPKSTKQQRGEFAKDSYPGGVRGWEKDASRDLMLATVHRKMGGLRVLRFTTEINKALDELRPQYFLEGSGTTCHFTWSFSHVSPIAFAAFGTALLLDPNFGYLGGKDEKFYPYRQRFGMCAHSTCHKFYFYGPGSKGTGHEHCSKSCSNAHRQLRDRRKKKLLKENGSQDPGRLAPSALLAEPPALQVSLEKKRGIKK